MVIQTKQFGNLLDLVCYHLERETDLDMYYQWRWCLQTVCLYELMSYANKIPRYVNNPTRLLNEVDIEKLATAIAHDVLNSDLVQFSVSLEECGCPACNKNLITDFQESGSYLVEKLHKITHETISKSQEKLWSTS